MYRPWHITLALLCIAFAAASLARNGIYETEVDLYTDIVTRSPNKARPHNNLGDALKKAGRVDEALPQFEQALLLKPDYPDAINNLDDGLQSLRPPAGGDLAPAAGPRAAARPSPGTLQPCHDLL